MTSKNKFIFSKHALEELAERKISIEIAEQVLHNPQQVISDSSSIRVHQSILKFDNKDFLLRIFVTRNKNPNVVATVYKTSKIKKYWDES